MPLQSHRSTERAHPWLGTLVSIRVDGTEASAAVEAIDDAFARVAEIHRLMSFHDAHSDVSRLNREAARRPVKVATDTYAVLRKAMEVGACSGGAFDIAVGRELVAWNLLPCPDPEKTPGQGNAAADIELLPDGFVAYRRPLWIDLGGIAKGYAVDCAVKTLREHGVTEGVVNAGGDLRVLGDAPERIALRVEDWAGDLPVVELSEGSMASSSGRRARQWRAGQWHGPHVDPRGGGVPAPAPTDRFVCVMAETCAVADALTKVVMVQGSESVGVLQHWGASAYFHDRDRGWNSIA